MVLGDEVDVPVIANIVRTSPTEASFSIVSASSNYLFQITYYVDIGGSFDQVVVIDLT